MYDVDGRILLEDSQHKNYYGSKFMIIIVRLHQLRIYTCEQEQLLVPLSDRDKVLEVYFGDITKVWM